MQPEDLNKNGYQLFEQLRHSEIGLFIRPYLFKKNRAIYFYWIFNFLVWAGIIISIFTCSISLVKSFDFFALGILGMLPLIPIHELIHGLFYKLAGAPSVQYKANFKKFIFYAMADKFITDQKNFVRLALAPFIIINSILIISIFLCTGIISFLLAGILFIHTAGCAGDFALVSYFIENDGRNLVTYDDVSKGESYFYKKTAY